MPYNHRFKGRKGKGRFSKFRKGKRGRKSFKNRGMQRIRKYKFGVRNIGGDKAFVKLRFVRSRTWEILPGATEDTQNVAFNVMRAPGGSQLDFASIGYNFGDSPNTSTLASLYLKYRVRGIKLSLTCWPTAGTVPVVAFINAQSDATGLDSPATGPTPSFVAANITNIGEQRWSKHRIINAAAAGARPTRLSAYYSVNKVFGPDQIVRNSANFIGNTTLVAPYYSQATETYDRPQYGPWLQYGITTMTGTPPGESQFVVMKQDVTVYAEFFAKRLVIQ